MEAMIAPDGTYVGKASHEILGEQYLRELGFSDKVCQLVGAHVMAKRYLTAIDEHYYNDLSQSSKMTLKFQVCCILRNCFIRSIRKATEPGCADNVTRAVRSLPKK